jgi:general stress protein 26
VAAGCGGNMHIKESDMSANEWLEVAVRIMRAAPYCFLVTLGENGHASARLMDPFEPEEDMRIWFGASPRSRKVREVRAHGRATVCYESVEERAYVTLQGSARIVEDQALRKLHWKDAWKRFWPDGPLAGDYVLVAVDPDRIELMDVAKGIAPDALTKPAVLVRVGDSWQAGEGRSA